ncbi:MAG: succinylglutamate desuccinylase/aspartoacylase family protein [Planctomycetes bacterium]|nr:succinylglutamate desuccinylase/aspartoacylase family protein [Planctomycetota bacterium]
MKPGTLAAASVLLSLGLSLWAQGPAAREPERAPPAGDPALATRAERSGFLETSSLEDVQAFLGALGARTDLLRVSSFGTSEEGRPLLLATLSNPPVASPRELRALGRPAVFVMANIHAGEVEGKEAVQNLMRRLTLGDLRPLLDSVVVLVAPDYNVDGNEAVDVQNRTEQHGPIAGVGRRENARGLDLNRDYMKLDSPEARALVRLFNDWDPQVVVDLHTTNGSYHGYHLTYSIPLNLSFEPRLLDYQRGDLMPALERAMLERHGLRTYYYGNFEGEAAAAGRPEGRTWRAFDHKPRLGQNYVGLRNRVAILSEAYSYLSFQERIAATERFVEEILRRASERGAELLSLCADLDREFVAAARGSSELLLGVRYEARPLARPVPVLVGEVRHELNPQSQKPMTVALPDQYTAVEMQDFGVFAPVKSVAMARIYALEPGPASRPIVEKLQQHGILVEELTAPLTAEVTAFSVTKLVRSERAFQNRRAVRLEGNYVQARATLEAGTPVVRLAQPLGRLAAYLLEPESDDGLVAWGLLDASLAEGRPAPVRKIMEPAPMAARALEAR